MQPVSESSNVDRLQFLFMNLVGHVVSVHAVDGSITEGLFVSRTDEDAAEPSIMLSKTRNRRSATCEADQMTELNEIMLVPLASVVFVNAVGVRVEAAAAGRVGHFRQTALEMNWADLPPEDDRAGGAGGSLEDEERGWETGKWDQFEANKKFGVKTTYKEDLYTTTLDKTKLSKEQIEYADRAARDIERSAARGLQHRIERGEDVDVDEGTLYSDVQRAQPTVVPERNVRQLPAAPCAVGTSAHSSLTTALLKEASTSGPLEAANRPYRAAAAVWGAMAASLDRRADASRRCAPDWPGDGGDSYDVEDTAYKRYAEERDIHHHQQHAHAHAHAHHHHHPQHQPMPLYSHQAHPQYHAPQLTSSSLQQPYSAANSSRGARYGGNGGGRGGGGGNYAPGNSNTVMTNNGGGRGGGHGLQPQQQRHQHQQHPVAGHLPQHVSGAPKSVQPQQPVPAAPLHDSRRGATGAYHHAQ